MATFTITTNEKINNPPNQIGDLTLNVIHEQSYTFSLNDFTTNTIPQYSDPEGDIVEQLQILTLPNEGTLLYNSLAVNVNDIIDSANVNLLEYDPNDSNNNSYTTNFTFTLSDVGSSTFSSEIGTVIINKLEAENEPPTEVGDGSATIDYGETLVFTRDMFTTQTTPPYSDPEGDAALNLKILTLPQDGLIQLNGSNVIVNQIISFSDIDSGLLTYVPDQADTDGDIENFTFSIADAGSGQFVE